MIVKLFNWISAHQYNNIVETKKSGLKYPIWYDSKFIPNGLFHFITPKMYIEINQNLIPIWLFFNKARIFGKYKNNSDVVDIVNGINKRMPIIKIYLSDRYDILRDSSFYTVINNLLNDSISNDDMLKLMIKEMDIYECQ